MDSPVLVFVNGLSLFIMRDRRTTKTALLTGVQNDMNPTHEYHQPQRFADSCKGKNKHHTNILSISGGAAYKGYVNLSLAPAEQTAQLIGNTHLHEMAKCTFVFSILVFVNIKEQGYSNTNLTGPQ